MSQKIKKEFQVTMTYEKCRNAENIIKASYAHLINCRATKKEDLDNENNKPIQKRGIAHVD
jgi:hypothetical protein